MSLESKWGNRWGMFPNVAVTVLQTLLCTRLWHTAAANAYMQVVLRINPKSSLILISEVFLGGTVGKSNGFEIRQMCQLGKLT